MDTKAFHLSHCPRLLPKNNGNQRVPLTHGRMGAWAWTWMERQFTWYRCAQCSRLAVLPHRASGTTHTMFFASHSTPYKPSTKPQLHLRCDRHDFSHNFRFSRVEAALACLTTISGKGGRHIQKRRADIKHRVKFKRPCMKGRSLYRIKTFGGAWPQVRNPTCRWRMAAAALASSRKEPGDKGCSGDGPAAQAWSHSVSCAVPCPSTPSPSSPTSQLCYFGVFVACHEWSYGCTNLTCKCTDQNTQHDLYNASHSAWL